MVSLHSTVAMCCAAVLLFLPASLYAQDVPGDAPTGATGDFGGDVTTAGCYNPYNYDAKRIVTDLVVPGASGSYPLVFTRNSHSNLEPVGNDNRYFGDGVNWRHSYQWSIAANYTIGISNGQNIKLLNSYEVAYPDGSVILYLNPNREGTSITFWRSPDSNGTSDRLEVTQSGGQILHRSDGGLVIFGNNVHPESIVDPNGATTRLTYSVSSTPALPAGYLTQVTEPGGRWLKFSYLPYTKNAFTIKGKRIVATWYLLDKVWASTDQSVSYTYEFLGSKQVGQGTVAYSCPFAALSHVIYNQETSNGGDRLVASYGNIADGTSFPMLHTAIDPHFAGAMTHIQYNISLRFAHAFLEEQNFGDNPGEIVSHFDAQNGRAETRGDLNPNGDSIKRYFNYGYNPLNSTQKFNRWQLAHYTDFEGNATQYGYDSFGFVNKVIDRRNNVTEYIHEHVAGKVTQVTLPDGRIRKTTWTDKGDNDDPLNPYYLHFATDERNYTTTYKHDPDTGLVVEVDYPDTSVETFGYQSFSAQNGSSTTFSKLSWHKSRLGATTYYYYDGDHWGTGSTGVPNSYGGSGHLGLLTTVVRVYIDANGRQQEEGTQLSYDGLDRLQSSTDPRGVTDTCTYNARHQVLSVTHSMDGTSVGYTYDDYGRTISVQDELLHLTSVERDEYGRIVSVTVPVNNNNVAQRTIKSKYDRRNNQYNVLSDEFSHTSNRPSCQYLPSGRAILHVYSPNDWVTDEYSGMIAANDGSLQPGDGYVHASTVYNPMGQIQSVTDAQLKTSFFDYDSCGRKTIFTDPNKHDTTWTYYASGEMALSGSGMNCSGLPKSITAPGPDRGSKSTVTTNYADFDVDGHVTTTIDPSNHTFKRGYDNAGNLISQDDGIQAQGAHCTAYGYDQLGRLVSITNPVANAIGNMQERWAYDNSGNVDTYTNYAGSVCKYQYDQRNRCYRYDWLDDSAAPTAYAYDAANRVREIANWHADIQYAYDDANNVISEQQTHTDAKYLDGKAPVTYYIRDADANVTAISCSGGFGPCYSYDSQGRCVGVYTDDTIFSHYTYSGNWLKGLAMGNGLCTTFDYQDNGRCTDIKHRSGDFNSSSNDDLSLRHFVYGYAPNGQISWFERESNQVHQESSLENGNGDAFVYKPDGSLTVTFRNVHYQGGWPSADNHGDSRVNEFSPDSTNSTQDTSNNFYDYDAAGNRAVFSYRSKPQSVYPVKGDDEYTDDHGSWIYDNNFNTARAPSIAWNYSYDAENHLQAAVGPQGASFQYDGLGRLVTRTINGQTIHFYYAGSQRIEERDANNSVVENYMFVSPASNQILMRQGKQYGNLWYQYDLMGNTSHVSNGDGNVVEQYFYDAYGQPSVYNASGIAQQSGSVCDNRYLFKGASAYEWLDQIGIYYAGARFYLPYHGRWLQPDPIGQAGGLNVYAYCHNDPVNNVDPSGLSDGESMGTFYYNGLTGDHGFIPNYGPEDFTIFGPLPYWIRTSDAATAFNVAYLNRISSLMGDAASGFYNASNSLVNGISQFGRNPVGAINGFIKSNVAEVQYSYNDPDGYLADLNDWWAAFADPHVASNRLGAGLFMAAMFEAGGGPAGTEVQTLDYSLIRFSQNKVKRNLPQIVDSMKANGWFGEPIDVVVMKDGALTSVDNTRLAAAALTKTPVQAIIRGFDEAFPASRAGGNLKGATWGKAISNRLKEQRGAWRRLYPNGSRFSSINDDTTGFTP